MANLFSKITGTSQRAAIKLNVRSALNPMLWLCAILTPICLIFAYFFRDTIEILYSLVAIGLFPIIITCLGFIYFALFRPEKLQSEEYQLRHETLQIIQQKTGRITKLPNLLQSITNPETKKLIGKEDNNA